MRNMLFALAWVTAVVLLFQIFSPSAGRVMARASGSDTAKLLAGDGGCCLIPHNRGLGGK